MSRVRHYLSQLLMTFAMSSISPARKVRPRLLALMGVKLPASSVIHSGTRVGSVRHRFGERVLINVDCHLDGAAPITIGDDVRIGSGTIIITGGHNIQPRTVRRDPDEATLCLPVTIERGCWLGAGCTVLPGVDIAEGCVIAAGAVVVRSTEANGLYAGVPARRIRDLRNEDRVPEALAEFDLLPLLRSSRAL
jgi:maltose O-acetyltransferase